MVYFAERNIGVVVLEGAKKKRDSSGIEKTAKAWMDYLVTEATIKRENIRYVQTNGLTIDEATAEVNYAFRSISLQRPETLVFIYSGHGSEEGIEFAEKGILEYGTIPLFLNTANQVIAVLDCCNAGLAIPALERANLIPHKGLFLGAAGAGRDTLGGSFTDDVLKQWRRGAYYEPGKNRQKAESTRIGEDLDHMLFPRKPGRRVYAVDVLEPDAFSWIQT